MIKDTTSTADLQHVQESPTPVKVIKQVNIDNDQSVSREKKTCLCLPYLKCPKPN